MNPVDFIKTIYLGDRGCKKIIIDGWNEQIKIQVTTISRVRNGTWDFYTDEDIENGLIVFSNVKSICFEPNNHIPNDTINYLVAEKMEEEGLYLFTFSSYSVNKENEHVEVITRIIANEIYLENPSNSNAKITE